MSLGSYEGDPIIFDPWQVAWLLDFSKLRAVEKAPQIGWSWACAAEATWECLLYEDATSGFVSVDQREASEKVLYAVKLYEGLPDRIKRMVPMPKRTGDELWFGSDSRPSRIMSIPATAALRGRRMSVYLDEVDFYRDGAEDAFRTALTRITRGGRMSMGSTCFGVDTQLDKVMRGADRQFSRARLPWNVAVNPTILESVEVSRQELPAESFSEEYECVRGGTSSDTFPAGMLRMATHEDVVLDDIMQLEASRSEKVIGYDVGTTGHPSVLAVLERFGGTWVTTVLQTIRGERLPAQERRLREVMRKHRSAKLGLDAKGIGLGTAQALEDEFGERVLPIQAGSRPEGLPVQDKLELILNIKRGLEAGELLLPQDRETLLQFNRTRILPGGLIEQPGIKKRSHYDHFWGLTYAWYVTLTGSAVSVYQRKSLAVIGGRSGPTW